MHMIKIRTHAYYSFKCCLTLDMGELQGCKSPRKKTSLARLAIPSNNQVDKYSLLHLECVLLCYY